MAEADAPAAVFVHRGVAAVQRLVEFAPASGSLALWVGHRDIGADDGPAAPPGRRAAVFTDGHTIFYRPAFEALDLPVQTGWVAHQVLHIALRHAPRRVALRQALGDVDAELFNLCADAIVNSALAHLRWLRLPAAAPMLEALLAEVLGIAQRAEAALAEWDVERLYRAVDDRRDDGRGGQRDGERAQRLRRWSGASALDLHPGPTEGDRPEVGAQAARDWAERLRRGHAGDGTRSILRALLGDLPRDRVPWEQVLRRQVARALTTKPAPSWSRPTRSWLANQGRAGPHRRLPWTPGTSHARPVPRLALVLDVSGSIDDGLLRRFAHELKALLRRLEAALVLIVGDDRVQAVHTLAPGRQALEAIDRLAVPGGGGTDFAPLLAEAQAHQPDLIVVLTDLQGPAGAAPRCPVLWAVPAALAATAVPFGRLLLLECAQAAIPLRRSSAP